MLELLVVLLVALTVSVVCGTVVYVARLYLPVAQRATEARAAAPMRKPEPIPNDLLMVASKWGDTWAKEQTIKSIQELYDSTGSWDSVRYVFSQQSLNGDE